MVPAAAQERGLSPLGRKLPVARIRPSPRALFLLLVLLLPAGCATLRGVLALGQVDFALDRVSGVHLAGVDVARVRSYEDLGAVEVARLIQAASQGRMPLSLTLHVTADNPEGNPEARLLALDWTFYLQDRETVSGGLPEAVAIPAAGTTEFPLDIQLDLLEFFEGSARDLLNLARSLMTGEGPPAHVHLVGTPTVETPLGPIRYPRPVTIVNREVGGG